VADHWQTVLALRTMEIDYEALVSHLERESRRLIAFPVLERYAPVGPACARTPSTCAIA
jgi:hypothetical protein